MSNAATAAIENALKPLTPEELKMLRPDVKVVVNPGNTDCHAAAFNLILTPAFQAKRLPLTHHVIEVHVRDADENIARVLVPLSSHGETVPLRVEVPYRGSIPANTFYRDYTIVADPFHNFLERTHSNNVGKVSGACIT